MAKDTDEQRKKPNKGKTALTWLMTGMLVVGLAGFSAGNFGGTITSIGSVGDIRLTTDDYARAVNGQINELSRQFGTQISMQDAIKFGLDRQALADLVTRATLDHTAFAAGLSVGDETVKSEIKKQSSFAGASGSFDPTIYRSTLARAGIKEANYEADLRADVARGLLIGAVSGGFNTPEKITQVIYDYLSERRSYSLIRLSEADLLAPLAELNDAELRAYYDANVESKFTKPESKRLSYAVLLPEELAAEQDVDDEALRKTYERRISEYVIPPRRLVERLVYPDQEAADAALAQAQAGKAFEDLVTDRGLTMLAVDMGDVSEADLGDAASVVFGATEGQIVSADSDLGPALYRVNGVLEGQETSFEEARASLAEEAKIEAARAAINSRIDEIDDLLAGGASLEELAQTSGMRLGTIDYAPNAQSGDPLEGYSAFRQAANAITEGDFPETIILENGGLLAMDFVETVPQSPIAYEEALPDVIAGLQAEKLNAALNARAEEIAAAAKSGTDFATLGRLESADNVAREIGIQNAPASAVTALFEMKEGEVRVLNEAPLVGVLRLNKISAAENDQDAQTALKEAISAQMSQAISQDALAAFTDAASREAGMTIDQNAITLVNQSLQ